MAFLWHVGWLVDGTLATLHGGTPGMTFLMLMALLMDRLVARWHSWQASLQGGTPDMALLHAAKVDGALSVLHDGTSGMFLNCLACMALLMDFSPRCKVALLAVCCACRTPTMTLLRVELMPWPRCICNSSRGGCDRLHYKLHLRFGDRLLGFRVDGFVIHQSYKRITVRVTRKTKTHHTTSHGRISKTFFSSTGRL